jgi:hypothetical protein
MNPLKEEIYNIIDSLNEAEDFITKKVGEDPTSTTWVVDYQPNLKRLYTDIDNVIQKLQKVQQRVQTPQSEELLKIAKSLRNRFARLLKMHAPLEEISATNIGGATFNAGEGPQYATPKVFNKNKNAKGAKNIYYYKLGYKNIPKHKPKSYDKKQLWEDEPLTEMNEFQKKRLESLDDIESLMNQIYPLISNARNKTIKLYGGDVGSYDITSPIEIVKSYLQDIKNLLTEE